MPVTNGVDIAVLFGKTHDVIDSYQKQWEVKYGSGDNISEYTDHCRKMLSAFYNMTKSGGLTHSEAVELFGNVEDVLKMYGHKLNVAHNR